MLIAVMTKSDPGGISFLTSAMPVQYYTSWGQLGGGRHLSSWYRYPVEDKNRSSIYVSILKKTSEWSTTVSPWTLEKFRLEQNLNPEPMRCWCSALPVDLRWNTPAKGGYMKWSIYMKVKYMINEMKNADRHQRRMPLARKDPTGYSKI